MSAAAGFSQVLGSRRGLSGDSERVEALIEALCEYRAAHAGGYTVTVSSVSPYEHSFSCALLSDHGGPLVYFEDGALWVPTGGRHPLQRAASEHATRRDIEILECESLPASLDH